MSPERGIPDTIGHHEKTTGILSADGFRIRLCRVCFRVFLRCVWKERKKERGDGGRERKRERVRVHE